MSNKMTVFVLLRLLNRLENFMTTYYYLFHYYLIGLNNIIIVIGGEDGDGLW